MPQNLCLVVDDESTVRELIKAVLQSGGFKTIEAENGVQAIELMRQLGDAVDLIISDVQMPRMDGLTLAYSVRAEFPAIPLILVSGYFEFQEVRDVEFDFVQKPFRARTLLNTVKKVLTSTSHNQHGVEHNIEC